MHKDESRIGGRNATLEIQLIMGTKWAEANDGLGHLVPTGFCRGNRQRNIAENICLI